MLDEGGLILLAIESAGPETKLALEKADSAALIQLARERRVKPMIFGHALYEHLISSNEIVRSFGVVLVSRAPFLEDPNQCRRQADQMLAQWIMDPANLREPSGRPGVPIVEELF